MSRYDQDKTWHSLYDAGLGAPLGNATQINTSAVEAGSATVDNDGDGGGGDEGSSSEPSSYDEGMGMGMSWSREFEHASVMVNCATGEGTIALKGQ